MSPPTFPPTPAPSTDIKGKDAMHLHQDDAHFQLPPSAVGHHSNATTKEADMLASPDSPEAFRRPRSDSGSIQSELALPPPPSRSRKIIQVKPKSGEKDDDAPYVPSAKTPKGRGKADAPRGKTGSASTAAGRKVARKTAHSIIERRRRSKMNEEFGVLKDLIPACRGIEMHKLAILQASIDYLRYLENCIGDLQAGRAKSSEAPTISPIGRTFDRDSEEPMDEADGDEEADEDDAMQLDNDDEEATTLAATAAAALVSPQSHAQHRASSSSSGVPTSALPSPFLGPRHDSTTSTSRGYSLSHSLSHGSDSVTYSTTTSPIFGPYYAGSSHCSRPYDPQQSYSSHNSNSSGGSLPTPTNSAFPRYAHSVASRGPSTQTSPVIVPKDQGLNEAEASTALLMLNRDRRHSSNASVIAPGFVAANTRRVDEARESRRGMSVRDLLGN